MKIAIVLGTRPEIIKMSPVIGQCVARNLEHFVIHTGQHYSYNMDRVFFEQLKLRDPKYNLEVGSGTHAEQTGRMLIGIGGILKEEQPDVVLVEGDTNSALAGALAASKLWMKVGHVEAGLRSFDRSMPEETNRVLADHLSDYLFAPTEVSRKNLLTEGVNGQIFVTGNTIVDAVEQNLRLAKMTDVRSRFDIRDDDYFVLTLHRPENVDNPERLRKIVHALGLVGWKFGKTIIFPVHPRTRSRLEQSGIAQQSFRIRMVEPLDYLAFLKLESEAELILTDSGGAQEEACILGVPCVTLRDNTERPETVQAGANILAGAEPTSILEKVTMMISQKRRWANPLGDGKASERIAEIINLGDGKASERIAEFINLRSSYSTT
jgi:UDP-N-acetylglucosamine 2-epimerase (non-hydrolysing)